MKVCLWNKSVLPDMYKNIQTFAFKMQFLGVQKWCSANVFSDTKQKYVCWKNCKNFCAKLYCKIRDIFSLLFAGFESFCWKFWFFFKKNFDDVHWTMWTNIKNCMSEIIFSKQEFQIWHFESYIFFRGDCFMAF